MGLEPMPLAWHPSALSITLWGISLEMYLAYLWHGQIYQTI